jgi:GNAT superfamily N-acetyltransferase
MTSAIALLSEAEGWNQTENDWNRLAGDPANTCLVAEYMHRIVGTATAMNYANDVAWIGMVIVDKEFRGRGISKMILSGLIRELGSCRSVKLDATPAGQPVYEKFGFKAEYVIYRMTNLCVGNNESEKSDVTPEPLHFRDIPEIALLDRSTFGAERTSLLTSLIKESPGKSWSIRKNGRITGIVLGRNGKRYNQIGPVSA